MAPSVIVVENGDIHESKKLLQSRKPLKSTGSLDKYQSIDVTPVIGTEFPEANLVEWLKASNTDELLRDLAIKGKLIRAYLIVNAKHGNQVSERGVVFFRAQENLSNHLQKQLIQRLGELTGKPATSTLHIHPILNSERELGGSDPEISTISSVLHDKLYKKTPYDQSKKVQSAAQWHSDIAFEPVPADYTSLRLTQLPRTGGGKSNSPSLPDDS